MDQESLHFDLQSLHPIIAWATSLTWFFSADDNTSEGDKSQLMTNLIPSEIGDDEFRNNFKNLLETHPQVQEAFTYLEEWRSNIKNLAFWLDKFNLSKYSIDIKKQSAKLVSRVQYLVKEIKEYGGEYDFRMTLISIK